MLLIKSCIFFSLFLCFHSFMYWPHQCRLFSQLQRCTSLIWKGDIFSLGAVPHASKLSVELSRKATAGPYNLWRVKTNLEGLFSSFLLQVCISQLLSYKLWSDGTLKKLWTTSHNLTWDSNVSPGFQEFFELSSEVSSTSWNIKGHTTFSTGETLSSSPHVVAAFLEQYWGDIIQTGRTNWPPSESMVNPNQLSTVIQKPVRVEGPGVVPVLRVVVDGEDIKPNLQWTKTHWKWLKWDHVCQIRFLLAPWEGRIVEHRCFSTDAVWVSVDHTWAPFGTRYPPSSPSFIARWNPRKGDPVT